MLVLLRNRKHRKAFSNMSAIASISSPAANRSRIRFAASRFSTSAPRRFSSGTFCNGSAAFCKAVYLKITKLAAFRAGSSLLHRGNPSRKLNSTAAWGILYQRTLAPVLFRNSKAASSSYSGRQGTGRNGLPESHPRPHFTARMSRTEATPFAALGKLL